ncbi:hypothetical protein BaRGS_00000322 [Batillaria attramentaria]|uniref:Transcriptional regulatory protein n=1 Tax=Batillaria attramentaria TaxID=370345 RepID=A0ABD0MDE1_9CAEN
MEGPRILQTCHHYLSKVRPLCTHAAASVRNGPCLLSMAMSRSLNSKILCHTPRQLTVVDCKRLHHIPANASLLKQNHYKSHAPSPWQKITVLHSGIISGSCVFDARRTMAGHSKWANIRHIKAAKDGARARLITDITQKARAIIKETGNADPKSNLKLARLIAEAKSKDVPNANIEKILSQMSRMKDASPMLFEAKGPAGSVMLIEALASKPQSMKGELQSVVRKCGFSMFDGGSLAMLSFVEKGVVTVDAGTSGEETVDMDRYIDIAIEAGAEEVTLEDETGEKILQFMCEPGDVYSVQKELEARELPVRSAEVVFLTTNTVPFPAQDIEKLSKVLDKLDDHPDVLKVYTNVAEAS